MKLGLFLMPSHPPEQTLYGGTQWDLEVIEHADGLGYDSAWVGEHFTSPWEPIPAPDLLLAQALLRTTRIKLAPGAHLLPFHHPAELAARVAYLDHLAQGRFMLGIGSSGLPSDWAMFNVDGMSGENRDMTRESLDIMLRLWADEGPFEYAGKFWTVNKPDLMFRTLRPHIRPFQLPHPPIGIAGLNPSSDTLKLAGERGFMPMSLNLNPEYMASHWESVCQGAERTDRIPNRSDWHVVREIFVAETDEEAFRWSAGAMMGRMMREYLLPLLGDFGFTHFYKHDPSVPDTDVTPEYLSRHSWVVGSVETCVEKLEAMHERCGGFGTVLLLTFDYSATPGPWKESMRLLAEEVLPRVNARLGETAFATA